MVLKLDSTLWPLAGFFKALMAYAAPQTSSIKTSEDQTESSHTLKCPRWREVKGCLLLAVFFLFSGSLAFSDLVGTALEPALDRCSALEGPNPDQRQSWPIK